MKTGARSSFLNSLIPQFLNSFPPNRRGISHALPRRSLALDHKRLAAVSPDLVRIPDQLIRRAAAGRLELRFAAFKTDLPAYRHLRLAEGDSVAADDLPDLLHPQCIVRLEDDAQRVLVWSQLEGFHAPGFLQVRTHGAVAARSIHAGNELVDPQKFRSRARGERSGKQQKRLHTVSCMNYRIRSASASRTRRKAAIRSSSDPRTAAGSSKLQCSRLPAPGSTGQVSRAWSHTVIA